ncbi:hypothetical protein CP973_21055 [Streptomyces albofaciens JCM 4342]|nr:hypothetical protein CP973_21055 [Streptomyces albofaciens JCM 4342]
MPRASTISVGPCRPWAWRRAGPPLMTEVGRFGAGGRVLYGPGPGDAGRWDWVGDIPENRVAAGRRAAAAARLCPTR